MLTGFDHFLVVDRTNGLLTGGFEVSLAPQTADSPEHNSSGMPIIYIKEPTDNARHIALGKFMDAWSKLENCIASSLCDATGLHRMNADVLMNALGTRGQLEVISLLGFSGLPAAQETTLRALLGRVRNNNTRRNHIVHGSWALEAKLYDANGKAIVRLTQQRRYPVSDPEMREALKRPENKRERAKYVFSVRRIQGITKELEQLSEDFSAFHRVRHGLPEGTRRYLVGVQTHGPE